MISLNPPYQVIDGYTVLSDHADPTLYYVLPSTPTLARQPNGKPAFSLLEFQGGGAGTTKVEGGLLTLTTELNVPNEVLGRLRGRIAKRDNRPPGDLHLTPVLFDTGTVELIALGASSGTPADAGATVDGAGGATPPPATTPSVTPTATSPFSVTFLGSGKPSLAGANTATFQLVLDALGAQLVEGALDAADLPLIAIYRMTFAGLRPSFQINIQADWSKVYHSLQQKAKANVYYVAADVDAMISSALEENNIRINTTVFGTDDGAHAAAERARKQLTDWVLEHLFQPMADPKNATANAIGQVIDDTVWSLARTILPGVSYRMRLIDEKQIRLLSARMDESVAERREVVPQGTLGGLLSRDRLDAGGKPRPEWPALRAQLLQQVPLNGFPRLEVKVASEDRFASDGLSEVRVELARPQPGGATTDNRTLAFRAAADRQNYVVNLLGLVPPDFSALYQYRQQIEFNPAGPFGPHPAVTTAWQTGRTADLFAEPRDAYMVREIEASVAPDFSFAQFPGVTVEVRYAADGDAVPPTGRLKLTADQPTQIWRFRSFAPRPLPYEYRATYHRPTDAGGDIQGEWTPQIDNWLSLPDPLPTKRPLNLFINLPWQDLSVAFVDLRYRDDKHGVHFDEHIDLTADVRFLRKEYLIAPDGPRTLSYRLTALPATGDVIEGSWRDTDDDRLVIDRHLIDRRRIAVQLIGGTLADVRLSEVRLRLQTRDPQTNHVRDETQYDFTADAAIVPPAPWEYAQGDPPLQTVYYNALFVEENGLTTDIPWTATQADLLVVQLRTKTITA